MESIKPSYLNQNKQCWKTHSC